MFVVARCLEEKENCCSWLEIKCLGGEKKSEPEADFRVAITLLPR